MLFNQLRCGRNPLGLSMSTKPHNVNAIMEAHFPSPGPCQLTIIHNPNTVKRKGMLRALRMKWKSKTSEICTNNIVSESFIIIL